MFFVGASAQLFIYLLIPAFLVVCCYFKSTGSSLGDFLSVSIVHEQKIVEYSKDTYVCKEEVEKQDEQQEVAPKTESILDIFTFYQYTFHHSPTLVNADLRAPPLSFI